LQAKTLSVTCLHPRETSRLVELAKALVLEGLDYEEKSNMLRTTQQAA
jgi:hypothetical protein